MCRIILFLVLSLLIFSSQASAADSQTIHGRLTYANGNPSCRIWIIGTKRLMGVRESGLEVPFMPEKLQRLMSWEREIYGDFIVTPLTPYKNGTMQIVRVGSAKNLVIIQDGKFVKRIKQL